MVSILDCDEIDMNYPDLDISGYRGFGVADLEDCKNACRGLSICMIYTYVNKKCWLKHGGKEFCTILLTVFKHFTRW